MKSVIDQVSRSDMPIVRGWVASPQVIAKQASRVARATIASAVALTLAACGSGAEETLEAVKQEAGAVASESRALQTLDKAIDEQALEGLARGAINGAVNEAIGEVLPAEEIAAVRAVVDEEAIAKSLGATLDGAADAPANDESAAR